MTVCSIDACFRPCVARGWCALHYQRWYSHGGTELIPPRINRVGAYVVGRDPLPSCPVCGSNEYIVSATPGKYVCVTRGHSGRFFAAAS